MAVTQYLQAPGHMVMLLPPRSPDLAPLDYAVFGHSKTWQQQHLSSAKYSWGERCTAFVKHLEQIDPVRQIGHYMSRLHKKNKKNKSHIQEKLRCLAETCGGGA